MKTSTKATRCKSLKTGASHASGLLIFGVLVLAFTMASDQGWGAMTSAAKVVSYPAPAGLWLAKPYRPTMKCRCQADRLTCTWPVFSTRHSQGSDGTTAVRIRLPTSTSQDVSWSALYPSGRLGTRLSAPNRSGSSQIWRMTIL